MQFRDDYPLGVWLDDLAEIIKRRDYINKKEALQLVVNDADEFVEMYFEGMLPQQAYQEMNE